MDYVITVAKWLVVSTGVGLVGGAFGTLFHHGVEHATHLRLENEVFLWALPFLGLIIVAIYHVLHTEGLGTNVVIDAVHQGYAIPILLVPSIFCGTILTHLAGGSAGREGAALQIGGGIGHTIGRALRMDEKDCRIATMCGMSALFSALFGTPLAATIFALEVISVGVLYYAAFIPSLTAALVAYGVSLWLNVEPTRFAITVPQIGGAVLLRTAVLAVLCALVCILFCEMLHRFEHVAVKLIANPYARAFAGGCVIIAITKLVGCYDYNGVGMDVINRAIAGEAKPEAFLLKMIFTAITLSCGFKGGEVIPTFFVGSTFGCVVGSLLGLPAGFAASVGITALFCGMVNCPITSLIIGIEMFGSEGLLCYAVACAVSYVLSGYRGLYSGQVILYSKLRAEFINIHTK